MFLLSRETRYFATYASRQTHAALSLSAYLRIPASCIDTNYSAKVYTFIRLYLIALTVQTTTFRPITRMGEEFLQLNER